MSGQGPFTNADIDYSEQFQVLAAANHSERTVGEFYIANPPMGHSASQMGPADFFGRSMAALMPEHVTIAVANVAIGGQSIDLFHKDYKDNYISTARNNNEWWIPYLDEYGGDVYNRIIEIGQIAKQKGVIKGILFHQGESDWQKNDWPERVKQVYDYIIADLELNADEVPILIGELATTEMGGDLGGRNTEVARAASLIPNGHVISASDCPVLVEPEYSLHFTREGYEILGGRYADKMYELLSNLQEGFPKVAITSPIASDIFVETEDITIDVDASDENGSIINVEFYNGITKIGEDAIAPYSHTSIGLTAGEYTIRVVAHDNDGNTAEAAITITVNVTQASYTGVPHPIPGVIQFEHFDVGGNGFAYFDDSPESETGNTFRDDEDVDIEDCTDIEGGYNLGYTTAGEWLEYTVDVNASGIYNMAIRAASSGAGKTLDVEIDGVPIANDVSIPDTEGWQAWTSVLVENVELTAGTQILRVTIGDVNYINLNYVNFTLVSIEKPMVKLTTGWNLIGCPLGGSTEISTALSSIWNNVISVKDMDSFYLYSQPAYLNTLETIDWGKGYFIKVSVDCEFEW